MKTINYADIKIEEIGDEDKRYHSWGNFGIHNFSYENRRFDYQDQVRFSWELLKKLGVPLTGEPDVSSPARFLAQIHGGEGVDPNLVPDGYFSPEIARAYDQLRWKMEVEPQDLIFGRHGFFGDFTIPKTLCLLGGSDELKHKKILDLGCGSVSSTGDDGRIVFSHNIADQKYLPWMARILSKFSPKYVGIDIGNLNGESFEHHNADLTQEGSLDFLESGSFDVAILSAFFPSQELSRILFGSTLVNLDEDSPHVRRYQQITGKDLPYYKTDILGERYDSDRVRSVLAKQRLMPMLKSQLERVLTQEGELFLD